MLIRIAILLLAAFSTCFAQTQGTTWHAGVGWPSQPEGRFDSDGVHFSRIEYGTTPSVIFHITHTSMTDSIGNLLFYSNGYYVFNHLHHRMSGGLALFDTVGKENNYYSGMGDAIQIPQYMLALPRPGTHHQFYLFYVYAHDTIAPGGYLTPIGSEIVYSEIDMSGNDGLGEIAIANQTLYVAEVPAGGVQACRHANGRDWWVLYKVYNQNRFLRLLVDPLGIHGPFEQTIDWGGINRIP